MENNQKIENNRTLKLNTKNTLYIGCAFFSILMLWQMYNHYCPMFLRYFLEDKIDNSEFIIGIIMAGDNALAIFMLPLFGSLSDKTNTRFGKRMPYIVIGMILSAILFPIIAIMFYFNSLVGVIIFMGIILIVMNMYRNPAVALMPDVTPKPLRSKANGIINFVGYLGGIIAGGIAMVLTIKDGEAKGNAIIAFVIASVFMVIAMLILIFKVKENKLIEENKADIEYGEKLSAAHTNTLTEQKLSKRDKMNFVILLAGILCWFMSFNAIETFNSLFCTTIFGTKGEGIGSTIVIILTVSSIITFLLTTNLPSKIGRKNCVLLGIGSLVLSFILIISYLAIIGVFTKTYINDLEAGIIPVPSAIPLYICIAICGFGWALINANSYPMLVEMSNQKTLGKFTGYYYTTSMFAQTLTPILVGFIMGLNEASYKILYIYSGILMLGAFIVMFFFKEKTKPAKPTEKGFGALDVD